MLFDVGIGALVAVVLSFLPFSSVLGGATAGWRGEGGYVSGLCTGSAAGVVAMIPLAALFVPALGITGYLGFGVSPSSPAYGVFLGLVALLFLLYTVGLSALGGLVGVWIRTNTSWDLDPLAWT